jgi:hypothetical protein
VVSGVSAAAVATDIANSAAVTDVQFTSGVNFSIDADRPANPASVVVTEGSWFGPTVDVNGTDRSLAGVGDSLTVQAVLGSLGGPVIFGDSLSVELQLFGKRFAMDKSANAGDTLTTTIVAAEGQFGDLDVSAAASNAIAVYLVDAAGNISGLADGASQGVSESVTYLFDTTSPALAEAGGDTLIPASNDTITDGGTNGGSLINGDVLGADLNVLNYELSEALDSLVVTFSGASDFRFALDQDANSTLNTGLGAGGTNNVNLTGMNVNNSTDITIDTTGYLVTGLHTITFQGTDLAGNVGSVVTRENVYVDVDAVSLSRTFPTTDAFGGASATRKDTIEETTAQVVFRLSEPADSVEVRYTPVDAAGAYVAGSTVRSRQLSGSQLSITDAEQVIPIDSLASGTSYALEVVARDLAGNYSLTSFGSFMYDTAYVVPVIQRFTISNGSADADRDTLLAGAEMTLTIQADASTDGSRKANAYKSTAILKVSSQNGGVAVTGDGLTDLGDGRYQLDELEWTTGSRTVTLKDTTSTDEITVAVVDSASAGGPYTGTMPDTLVIEPGVVHGARIDTYNDHRMAMCFSVMGALVPDMVINKPECVKKTFPNFYQKLASAPPLGLGMTITQPGSSLALSEDLLFA